MMLGFKSRRPRRRNIGELRINALNIELNGAAAGKIESDDAGAVLAWRESDRQKFDHRLGGVLANVYLAHGLDVVKVAARPDPCKRSFAPLWRNFPNEPICHKREAPFTRQVREITNFRDGVL